MINRLLSYPKVYTSVQKIFSLRKDVNRKYLEKTQVTESRGLVLDVGCGTGRYAFLFSSGYVGIDLEIESLRWGRNRLKSSFLQMDAAKLGFGDNRFEHVFSVGLFHHVSDRQAAEIIREMGRVCRQNGSIIVIDAIFPTNTLNFIGYLVNRLDRGKFMRRIRELSNLLEVDGLTLLDKSVMKSFPLEVGAFHFRVK